MIHFDVSLKSTCNSSLSGLKIVSYGHGEGDSYSYCRYAKTSHIGNGFPTQT